MRLRRISYLSYQKRHVVHVLQASCQLVLQRRSATSQLLAGLATQISYKPAVSWFSNIDQLQAGLKLTLLYILLVTLFTILSTTCSPPYSPPYMLTTLLVTLHAHHPTRHPTCSPPYSPFYMLTILLTTLPTRQPTHQLARFKTCFMRRVQTRVIRFMAYSIAYFIVCSIHASYMLHSTC